MAKAELIQMAKESMEHAEAGTLALADSIQKIPASNYFDPDRYQAEVDMVFKRMPLVLAPSAELPENGDYKAMNVVNTPVLLTRGKDGVVRGFLNSCTHRGTNVVLEGTGNASRFVCGYHGWTFDREGRLIAIASNDEFGEVDKSCHGLTPLRVFERAGIIWGILDPESNLDFDNFMSGYDEFLAEFGMDDWHLFQTRTVRGPNWKIAYDGYLDLYHLPVLHRETFGEQMSNQALYYAWGPHQRVTSPTRMDPLKDIPVEDWPSEVLLLGVWTIFPHISIASFDGGGRSIMLSQLFPGENPGESYTTQYYLMQNEPNEEQAMQADEQFKLLKYVVEVEDYGTGLRQQKALESGALKEVMFGRNEGGGQNFHGWVDRLLKTKDEDLNSLFQPTAQAAE
ncbi:MAG: aromatic ring-hydroxylating oxygenase subunit alpha [Alphaproteobacteria bacterium]